MGADFAAIKEFTELEEHIGKLLLRSDVCFSGHHYCLALATFDTQQAVDYLHEYLDYYLTKKELYFDQASAMAAISFIGSNRNEELVDMHMDRWNSFIENKEGWNLQTSIHRFNNDMESIAKLRNSRK